MHIQQLSITSCYCHIMYSNIDLDSVYSLNQLCYLKLSLFVCRGWILETVLGEVEKDSFITGSGKRIHPRILAWKTMYTNNGRNLLKVFLTWVWAGFAPWRRKWQPTPVFLPGKSHGLRSLVGYSPWGGKETGLSHFTNLFSGGPPNLDEPL